MSEQKKIASAEKKIHVYCDGACQGNPGKAGIGLAIYLDEEKHPILLFGRYVEEGTNNIAELNALLVALQIIKTSKAEEKTILSDSKYSIDCVTNWAYGWKKRGWTKKGGEIKNLDIIKKAHTLYDAIKDTVEVNYPAVNGGAS